MTDQQTSGAILTVDLAAVAENYRHLAAMIAPAKLAAVIKANAYGLGIEPVARKLSTAGCTTFFVATVDEGLALRDLLSDPDIHVFNGAPAGCESTFQAHRLTPVLNSLEDIARWKSAAPRAAADLHVDTGMVRLGLTASDVDKLNMQDIEPDIILSHLACSDTPDHPMNAAQISAFQALRAKLGGQRGSIAASSGVFLGTPYHLDLVRAGAALYGVNPTPSAPNPMRPVIRLQARILQVREVSRGTPIGYGATHTTEGTLKIATVAIGYADGYMRSGSDQAIAYVGDTPAPVVGRISMDLTALDVSAVSDDQLRIGDLVDMIGPANPIDDVAAAAGTIGYEILTGLGRRLYRTYVGC